MAKFKIWVSTKMVGSRVEDELEIPDEDVEGMSEDEIWEEIIQEIVWDMMEANYKRVD